MKVLIVKTSSMGDIIHTLPALSDAKTAIPEIEFDWVVEEAFAEIPGWHANVKKTIPMALRRWRQNLIQALTQKEIQRFIVTLRIEPYDCIIDAQGLIKSAMLAVLARGKSCGFAFNAAREPIASWFYNESFAIDKKQHAISRVRQLFAQTLGYDIAKMPLNYGIKQFFTAPQGQEKYLVFIHGSARGDKCWDDDKWIELAKLAYEKGLAVKLPWGNELELKRAEKIVDMCSNVKILPKSKLGDLAVTFLGAVGVVSIDTGLGHLAAALDVPTVSLYQTTDPGLIGTVGKQCKHVVNAAVVDVWNELERDSSF